MLTSEAREYDQQQRLTALAVAEAQRLAPRGPVVVARSVQTYQAAAIAVSMAALGDVLAEQGIDDAQDATAAPLAFLTGISDLAGMFAATESGDAAARLVQTTVADARRTTRTVDAATRPAVTGYVRRVTTPCCSRCAVLAGRVYRFSEGFRRHPRCDCDPSPTDAANGRERVTDPTDLFDRGLIRGLGAADSEALKMGANLGQVVNVRRKAAGLTVGSSVMERAGRLTPQGCLSLASDRAQALALLKRYRYIT